jgi:hypothetical protein
MVKKQSKVVRHPWERWFRKKKFTLVQGKDYQGMTHAMGVQVRNAACRLGLSVTISIAQNKITHSDCLLITVLGAR